MPRRALNVILPLLSCAGCCDTVPLHSLVPGFPAAGQEDSVAAGPAQGLAAEVREGGEAGTMPKDDLDARVRRLVMEHGKRPVCNDLNGCAMVGVLVGLGPGAGGAVREAYRSSQGDGYWRFRLLEVLGRMGSPKSTSFLVGVLRHDSHETARVEAALALARIKDRSVVPALLDVVDSAAGDERHRAVLLAAGYALAVLGHPRGRALVEEQLVVPEGPTLRWDQLRPGVFAAGRLRMKHLRERVESILVRADPFVRREAAVALGAMRDQEAVHALVEALRDRVPGVREAALRSLRSLTGFRHKETYEQWSRWLQRERSPARGPAKPR